MLSSKNDQIKELRQSLSKYEAAGGGGGGMTGRGMSDDEEEEE